MTLLSVERPAIGLFSLFGFDVWQGWVMVVVMVMAIGVIPPLILGYLQMKPAKQSPNKVLHTDSKMNKADWLASMATVIGVTSVGFGIWWADAVAEIIISLDILKDGVDNLRASLSSLTDSIPVELGTKNPHPLPAEVNRYLMGLDRVREAGCRVREEGRVFHIAAFVIYEDPGDARMNDLSAARQGCLELDWKILDVVVRPVEHLPLVRQTDMTAPAEP